MWPAWSWHLTPVLFCCAHHQLPVAVEEQAHKTNLQLLFSKTCFKVIQLQKGVEGLPLNQRGSSDICCLAGADSAGDSLSIEKCVGKHWHSVARQIKCNFWNFTVFHCFLHFTRQKCNKEQFVAFILVDISSIFSVNFVYWYKMS